MCTTYCFKPSFRNNAMEVQSLILSHRKGHFLNLLKRYLRKSNINLFDMIICKVVQSVLLSPILFLATSHLPAGAWSFFYYHRVCSPH